MRNGASIAWPSKHSPIKSPPIVPKGRYSLPFVEKTIHLDAFVFNITLLSLASFNCSFSSLRVLSLPFRGRYIAVVARFYTKPLIGESGRVVKNCWPSESKTP